MPQVLYKRVAEDLHTVTLQEGPKAMTRELNMAIDFDLVTCRKNEENGTANRGNVLEWEEQAWMCGMPLQW